MPNNIFIPYKADTTMPPYLPFLRFLITLNLSNDAKVLYAMLLDRAGISKENGYIETDGAVRLYFTVQEAKEKLHRSRQVTTCNNPCISGIRAQRLGCTQKAGAWQGYYSRSGGRK